MKELLSDIELAKPLFLWLMLGLPLLWLRLREQRPIIILGRALILLLLILALADPHRVTQQAREEERLFAFDISQSITTSMRRWMESAAQGELAPRPRDHVFVFASEARESFDWRDWLKRERGEHEAIPTAKTNLEKLLTVLLALSSAPRSVLLFTDGWETEGNIERLLPAIAASGLKIFPIVPAQQPRIANVAVNKLVVPNQGRSGENVNLRVVIENQSDREVEGTLVLTRNGQNMKSEGVKLRPGSQIYTYQTTFPDNPITSYRAQFTPQPGGLDINLADNQAVAWVSVKTKAKVLLLNGQSGGGRYLEEILKRQGFEVTSRAADNAPSPSGYAVVIFNNVERGKFSSNYLTAVERHTAQGNGFLMLGSEASFGPRSFNRTPIEALLPVEPKEPKREEKNRAVVLVIDKSGSMREENRILYAQEAAKAVARQLKDNDLLGVVAFDVTPFVVVPLEPVGKLRGVIDGQINRLKPGGQTYFYPALIEAKRQIERANAARKHVILLSDGETRGTQGELVDLVSVMKNEMKVTVSTVAIGVEADVPIMKRISQYGGGFFHQTIDPTSLPQIVIQQIQEKPPDEPKGERELTPVQERGSEILAGFSAKSYPRLLGYMETELKRGAHLDLILPREDRKAPLMASWRYQKGRAAALTTDFEGRWSRNWIQWGSLQPFWAKVFGWLHPSDERDSIPVHEARVGLSANRPFLDLFVYEDLGPESHFHFAVNGKGGKLEGGLQKLAAGHYQVALPLTTPGDYRIELTEERRGQRIVYPPIGYSLPYELDTEIPRADFNLPLLNKLAQASGGEVNPKLTESSIKPEITKTYLPLRQLLMIWAAALFLFEIVARKLFYNEA
ncbi:MAG TPA: VWA domain-containing protein [Candidatus Binatia bacterium]|nr:VWA domain-containing protein [Candidatus Binatia bacterium]